MPRLTPKKLLIILLTLSLYLYLNSDSSTELKNKISDSLLDNSFDYQDTVSRQEFRKAQERKRKLSII